MEDQGDAPANYFPQGDVWNQFAIVKTTSYHVFLMCFASGGCSSPGSAGDLNFDAGYAFVTNFTAQVRPGRPNRQRRRRCFPAGRWSAGSNP